MADENRSASWASAGEMWYEVYRRYHRRTEVRLVPPNRRVDGRGWTGWSVVATARAASEGEGRDISASASFGPFGSHRTAPDAILAALAELYTRLQERETTVAKQSRF